MSKNKTKYYDYAVIQFIYRQLRARWGYQYSKMFLWEPEGCYRCTMSMTIVPFCFSMEHLWIVIVPFWFSMEHLWIVIAPFWFSMEHLWIVIAPFWLSTHDMMLLYSCHTQSCLHAGEKSWSSRDNMHASYRREWTVLIRGVHCCLQIVKAYILQCFVSVLLESIKINQISLFKTNR